MAAIGNGGASQITHPSHGNVMAFGEAIGGSAALSLGSSLVKQFQRPRFSPTKVRCRGVHFPFSPPPAFLFPNPPPHSLPFPLPKRRSSSSTPLVPPPPSHQDALPDDYADDAAADVAAAAAAFTATLETGVGPGGAAALSPGPSGRAGLLAGPSGPAGRPPGPSSQAGQSGRSPRTPSFVGASAFYSTPSRPATSDRTLIQQRDEAYKVNARSLLMSHVHEMNCGVGASRSWGEARYRVEKIKIIRAPIERCDSGSRARRGRATRGAGLTRRMRAPKPCCA